MDWREFTGREHRCRMVAIRGHTWRICMRWRTKRGQRSGVHGAKCTNDGVRSYHFVIAVWRAKETECGPGMKCSLGVLFLVIALALPGIAQNSEQPEKP